MTDQPARWIEQAQEIVFLPAEGWTEAEIDVIVARLNADGLRRLFEAVQADETKEGAA
jgi:hypothetical protein